MLTPAELAGREAQATSGDNLAAQMVAAHYRETGSGLESIKWLELAAGRGDCNATLLLADPAYLEASDHARWNAVAGARRCPEVVAREIERDRGYWRHWLIFA